MKRLRVVLFASALALGSVTSAAQAAIFYPPPRLENYGGSLGIEVDTTPLVRDGVVFLKIMSLTPASPFYRYIHPGDFVFGVNGYNIRNADDFTAVIHSGSPGALISVDYLDAADNLVAKEVRGKLISYDVAFAPSKPATTADQPWCTQSGGQLAVCAAGAALIIGAIAAALSGDDHSSSSGSSQSSSGDNSNNGGWRPDPPQQQAKKEEPVDNGVGCSWGYESMGTCVK